MQHLTCLAVTVLGVLITSKGALAAPQTWAGVEDLGTLGGQEAVARGVSADGRVIVGWSRVANDEQLRPCIWRPGLGIQDLGAVTGGGQALDVSADGSVVVGTTGQTFGFPRAFRWTALTGLTYLGTVGGAPAEALGISADGVVIVGTTRDVSGRQRAFRWTIAIGMQDLGALAGGTAVAAAASADGSVIVGWSTDALGVQHAVRWTVGGGLQDLGLIVGGGESRAYAVSDDGAWVAGFCTPVATTYERRAVVWDAQSGAVQRLGSLDGVSETPRAMSADVGVVVGYAQDPSTQPKPFRAELASGFEDLGTMGGNIGFAYDVTDDGRVVVGGAEDSAGRLRAVRWFPGVSETYCSPAVPNSSGRSAVMTVLGSDVLAANAMQLTARFLPANKFGYFLVSTEQASIYPLAGSQGKLCLGGAIGRFARPGQVVSSGQGGTYTVPIDLTALPTPSGPVAGQVGETYHFQSWFRDANPSATTNFTDAVTVTLR